MLGVVLLLHGDGVCDDGGVSSCGVTSAFLLRVSEFEEQQLHYLRVFGLPLKMRS